MHSLRTPLFDRNAEIATVRSCSAWHGQELRRRTSLKVSTKSTVQVVRESNPAHLLTVVGAKRLSLYVLVSAGRAPFAVFEWWWASDARNSFRIQPSLRLRRSSVSKRRFSLLLAACLVTSSLWAANDSFLGKWKLNPSQSRFPDEMKVTSSGENKYAFDFGGGQPETIVTDGTDQPGIYATTLAVTVEAPDTWKVVRKKDGRTLLTATWKLSDDGQTLSDFYRESQSNGATLSMDYVYKRSTPGSGFAATWDSVSEKMNSLYEVEIKPYEDDGLTFITAVEGNTLNVKFDGKDYADIGSNASPDSVSSGRQINERTLEVTRKFKGKVRQTRDIELSPDRKTLTMTLHRPTQEKQTVLVFDRE